LNNSAVCDPKDVDPLEDVLYKKPGYLIRQVHQAAEAIFIAETKGTITPVQYGALAAIRAYPGIDQIGVAGAIGLDRTTIAGVMERLELKGLITRKVGTKDRRTRSLVLSAAGQKLLREAFPMTERVQSKLLEPLPKEQRELFISMLHRLAIDHDSLGARARRPKSGAAKAARK
jgi:DNA-binding MarR family transcriptional regulator